MIRRRPESKQTPLPITRTLLCALCAALFACASIAPTAVASQDQAPPEPASESEAATRSSEPDAGGEAIPRRFASPRATMFTFLEAMNEANEARRAGRSPAPSLAEALETFDLPDLARESATEQATRLYGVLNRIGEIRPWQLPDEQDAAREDLRRFVFFPSGRPSQEPLVERAPNAAIALVRTDSGAWRFSEETIAGIDELYARVEDLPTRAGFDETALSLPLRIRSWMPAPLRQASPLWLEWWQWAGLAALIFGAVVIDFLVQTILRRTAAVIIRRRKGRAERETLRRTMRPFGLFAGALAFTYSLALLGLPAPVMAVLIPAARFVLMLAGVWSAVRLTDLVAEVLASKAAGTTTRFDDLLIPLIRKTVKILIVAFGLIYLARYVLNVDILPLITGLGIGGLAVAFAAKDTIENFFGSVAVILDRPFEVGDWVKTGDVEGTVEELGFRSTRIRTFYNSLVTVPNSTLVRATVDNFGRRRYRRLSTHLNIAYDTPPAKIEAFCEAIRELVRLHPFTRKDYYHVRFHQFGAHSLDILLYVFHECPDWQTELRERERLFLDVLRVAERLGVEFAYPTQTLYLKRGQEAEGAPVEEREADAAGVRIAAEVTRGAEWRERQPPPMVIDASPRESELKKAAGAGPVGDPTTDGSGRSGADASPGGPGPTGGA